MWAPLGPRAHSLEISENVPATERACHIEIAAGVDATALSAIAARLTGLTVQAVTDTEPRLLVGRPEVSDTLEVARAGRTGSLTLSRDVRAFFQGNRFLLEPLASYVSSLVPEGPVIDLYAGVGLFGLSLAALGFETVTLVEGDRVSGASLTANAVPFGAGVTVQRMSVEDFLRASRTGAGETVVVDPPRTGLSREALQELVRRKPGTLVYVSCDVATLARDARVLVDAGYGLDTLRSFDLFPNTAHVETVAAFHWVRTAASPQLHP